MCIYVKTWMDLCCSDVYIIHDLVFSPEIGINRSEIKSVIT